MALLMNLARIVLADETKLIVGIIVFVVLVLVVFPIRPWLTARLAGVKLSIFYLQRLRWRRVPADKIIQPLIRAVKAGLSVPVVYLEVHYLAGGNGQRVVDALIAAKAANIPLDFAKAAAIDIAGGDILETIRQEEK